MSEKKIPPGHKAELSDSDGVIVEVYGYQYSRVLTVLTYIGYLLTLGGLWVFYHWIPHLRLLSTHKKCSLEQADKVLIKDQYKRKIVQSIFCVNPDGIDVHIRDAPEHRISTHSLGQGTSREAIMELNSQPSQLNMSNDELSATIKTTNTWDQHRFFRYKKIKYEWNAAISAFKLMPVGDSFACSRYHEMGPLDKEEVQYRQVIYGKNLIIIPITPILRLLLEQGLTPFYLFQVFSCILWFYELYYVYAIFIVVLSSISLVWQMVELRLNEIALRMKMQTAGTTLVLRKGQSSSEAIDSAELVPGDIIEIPKMGCLMFCDAVLIQGNCVVNESMLTGESVPLTKTPLSNTRGDASASDVQFSMKAHAGHMLYCGTNVLQTRTAPGLPTRAVVLRTGFSTAKGDLVRSILFPKPVQFQFNRDVVTYLVVLFTMALCGFIYTVKIMVERGNSAKDIVVRTLDLVTIIVPPALPLAMTVGIVFAQRRLKEKKIFCISPNTINVAGVTSIVCFDKTGTLTEEGLSLWGVIPTDTSRNVFGKPQQDPSNIPHPSALIECMASCHSLARINGELMGDPLDLIMFHALQWDLRDEEDDHKQQHQPTGTTVMPMNSHIQDYQLTVIRQFTFSSSLQRMSVVAHNNHTGELALYVKGSPEMIHRLSLQDSLPDDYFESLMTYTREGYRVLALAWRPLSLTSDSVQRVSREQVECQLRFLGFLVLENRIKPESRPVIDILKQANIRSVMITGDNMLTALSVARDCNMVEEHQKILVVHPRHSGDMSSTNLLNSDQLLDYYYVEDLQKAQSRGTEAKYQRYYRRRSYVIALERQTMCPVGSQKQFVSRMLERPDFRVALTGHTWSYIREHCPEMIPKLMVKGLVFARFSPDQKAQVVEALQDLGHYVTMCGDGANDCGALKTAHAGISLSEAEASVASPFTSQRQNISCVPDLIREGRCSLATGFGTFQYMAAYSMTQFLSVLILYWIGTTLGDYQFLYEDLFLTTTMSITFSATRAYHRLSKHAPSVRLLSFQAVLSLLVQILIVAGFQVLTYFYIVNQPWYLPLDKDNAAADSFMCHLDTGLFIVSVYQYIIVAIVFCRGPPYRKTILQNPAFTINLFLLLVLTTYMVIYPFPWFKFLVRIIDFPHLYINLILIGFAFVNLLLAYIFETLIDGNGFRRLMKRCKTACCAKCTTEKKYVSVMATVDSNLANWPFIQATKSLTEVPAGIFADGSHGQPVAASAIDTVKENTFNGVATTSLPSEKKAVSINNQEGPPPYPFPLTWNNYVAFMENQGEVHARGQQQRIGPSAARTSFVPTNVETTRL